MCGYAVKVAVGRAELNLKMYNINKTSSCDVIYFNTFK